MIRVGVSGCNCLNNGMQFLAIEHNIQLDKKYVDIYGISIGNPSFQSYPMPFRSPTKPVHFTKEIENLRGENGMPRFFQFLTVLKPPISIYVFFVICHISMLTYDIFCH